MTRYLDVLAYVQTHLDADLSLASLAARARLSVAHFQRGFRREVGESPRAHVERMRLERSALQLLMREASVMELAIEHGFQSHEVYTRAFRRRFGVSPSQWRLDWSSRRAGLVDSRSAGIEQALAEGKLSATRVHELRPLCVACIRHTGPYEAVDLQAWRELTAWAEGLGIAGGGLLGIAHDPPALVEASRLRFDCCLIVPDDAPAPRAGSRITLARLAGGAHALTTYVGPLAQLEGAYRAIVQRLLERKLVLIGLPAIERYSTTQILTGALQQIEIALPVQRR